ncbi:unnamed protein product [Dibothriocephalus latus]|uniref:Serine/threonine specific protein phosphatases domain-containing protein n=1 Tax=Dibothriocephalus latus TaxID=60516 RepID=A0A3P7LUL3_DIBLA|nr:unnamed protein product [Dibothriocephalus latus]
MVLALLYIGFTEAGRRKLPYDGRDPKVDVFQQLKAIKGNHEGTVIETVQKVPR